LARFSLSFLRRAPACGDVMRLQIKVDDKGVITEAKFKVRSWSVCVWCSVF
jgi:NifU-like protein involved in Fe-S cluster formation